MIYIYTVSRENRVKEKYPRYNAISMQVEFLRFQIHVNKHTFASEKSKSLLCDPYDLSYINCNPKNNIC